GARQRPRHAGRPGRVAAHAQSRDGGARHVSVQQLAARRKLAMLDFDDGLYLEAERDLTELVDVLRDSDDPGAGYELGRALLDRATARRFLNRWDDASADVDACEQLVPSLPQAAAASLLP